MGRPPVVASVTGPWPERRFPRRSGFVTRIATAPELRVRCFVRCAARSGHRGEEWGVRRKLPGAGTEGPDPAARPGLPSTFDARERPPHGRCLPLDRPALLGHPEPHRADPRGQTPARPPAASAVLASVTAGAPRAGGGRPFEPSHSHRKRPPKGSAETAKTITNGEGHAHRLGPAGPPATKRPKDAPDGTSIRGQGHHHARQSGSVLPHRAADAPRPAPKDRERAGSTAERPKAPWQEGLINRPAANGGCASTTAAGRRRSRPIARAAEHLEKRGRPHLQCVGGGLSVSEPFRTPGNKGGQPDRNRVA